MATMANRHYCGKCHLTYVVSPEEAKKNAAAAAGKNPKAAKGGEAPPAGAAPAKKAGKGKK
jgi:hypothetical protein